MTERPCLNILVVEDDPDIRMIARLSLETTGGHTVATAENGEEGLRLAATFRPDVILLDVMMPGMTGPQMLAELRRQTEFQHTPVVFLTAKAQPAEIASYLTAGALAVIAKPFDPMTLVAELEAILARAPRQAAAVAEAPAVLTDIAPASPGARRVLVIEDDAEIAYILQFLLSREGFEVTLAADGRAAEAHIHGSAPPTLVMLDVMLPYIDGFQLLGTIRTQPGWEKVTVIMLTAKSQEAAIERALAQGADDFVAKPFQPIELMARLRHHLK